MPLAEAGYTVTGVDRDWFLSQSGESFGVEAHEFVVRNFDADGPVTYLYEERFSPLTSRLRWHIRTAGTTPERSATADYRIYSAHELCTLLSRAGLPGRRSVRRPRPESVSRARAAPDHHGPAHDRQNLNLKHLAAVPGRRKPDCLEGATQHSRPCAPNPP